MAEINLAPGTEYLAQARRRRRRVFSIAALIALLMLAAWGGLFLFRSSLQRQQRDLDSQLSAVEAEILRLGEQAERVKLFEERLGAIAGLINTHVSWDPFLKDLERVLPPPTVITRLKVDTKSGTVEIGGETPDVDAVAQTLASLAGAPARPTIFKSAALDSINRHEQTTPEGQVVGVRYEFAAVLTLDSQQLRYGQ